VIGIPKIALYIKRRGILYRGEVEADFALQLLEQNFPENLLNEFFKWAKAAEKVCGYTNDVMIIDEEKKEVISNQIVFGLETLENIYEPWEYIEENIYARLEALKV